MCGGGRLGEKPGMYKAEADKEAQVADRGSNAIVAAIEGNGAEAVKPSKDRPQD